MIYIFLFLSFLFSAKMTTSEKYNRALEYYRNNELDKAKEIVLDILSKNPKNNGANALYKDILRQDAKRLFRAALIYFEEGDIDEAEAQKKEGISIFPEVLEDIIEEEILKIKSLLTERKIIQAKLKIERLYFLSPEDKRVIALKKLTEFKFFKQLLKEVQEKKKFIFEKKLNEAKKYFSKGEFLFALNSVNEALEYQPKNKEAIKLQKKLRKTIFEAKKKLSEKEKQKLKEKVNSFLKKMEKYYKKKKFYKVVKTGKKILALDPTNKKASAYYDEAAKVLSNRLLEKAFLEFQRGKKKKAKKMVEKARDIYLKLVEKKSEEFINEAKKIKAQSKEQQKLKAVFLDFSLLLNPEKEKEVKFILSGSKLNLEPIWDEYHRGDFKKVKGLLESLKKNNPENDNIKFMEYLNNAQIALDEGDFKKAREQLIQAVRINPLHEEVWGFFERLEEVIEVLGL